MAITGISNPYSSYGNYVRQDAANQSGFSAAGTNQTGTNAAVTNQTGECQTCKERKYQDGSDENVSFKSASHISPEAAGVRVAAHEAEHVSNAYSQASQENGEVVSASVSLHTGVCPECGRVYVSGGETRTMIKYPNEANPYQQERKSQDAAEITGANVDYVA